MDYVKLKDVCTINMGQSPSSDSYNENGHGVPFFQGNADFGERYPVTRKWCSAPTKMAAPEDILISVRAPIGAMNYAKEECCIGRGLAALTPNREKVAPEYIFWLLKGKNEELNCKGTGSTFKAIGRNILEETLVPNISLEKQTECAIILEKTYRVILSRKQQLQNLDKLVKARFVEQFSAKESYKIDSYAFDCEALLLAGNNAAGIYDVKHYKGKFNAYQRTYVLRLMNEKWSYILFKRQLEDKLQYLQSQSKGTNTRYLTLGILNELRFVVPPVAEQEQFAVFVEQTDKSKVAVQKALDETQLLFDSLMQKYFG